MYRKLAGIAISVLLAIALLAVMLVRVWDELLVTLSYLEPIFILAAIGVSLLSWIIRGWRYQQILLYLDIRVRYIFATACIFFSQTVNLIVPARLGDFIRIIIIRHEYDATVSKCLSSVIIERLFDIITVAVLGLFSLLFVLNVPEWFIPLIIIPLILCVAFAVFLLVAGTLPAKNPVFQFLIRMFNEVKEASLTKKSVFFLSVSSFVMWGLEAAVCMCIALMFQEEIPFMVVVLAIVIGNLVKAIPLTPGGIGTYELAVALTLELAGTAPAVAFLIAVIDHLIKNGITLFGGLATIPYFGQWLIPTMVDTVKEKVLRG